MLFYKSFFNYHAIKQILHQVFLEKNVYAICLASKQRVKNTSNKLWFITFARPQNVDAVIAVFLTYRVCLNGESFF